MIIAAILAVAFFAGAFAGVMVLMRLVMIGDMRGDGCLPDRPRTRAAATGRLVAGLHVCRDAPDDHATYTTAYDFPRQRPPAVHPPAIPCPGHKATCGIEKKQRRGLP